MKVEFSLSIGLVGCHRKEVQEFEDDATDEEIQDAFLEWVWNTLDAGWDKVDE